MRKNNRITRYLYKLHRYAGLLSAIILLMLAVTGIALNHTDDLKLDSQMIQSPSLLDWYGIEAPNNVVSFSTKNHHLTLANQQLYFNDSLLQNHTSHLLGAVETEDFVIIALNNSLLLMSLEGELIESIPLNSIKSIGVSLQGIVTQSESGLNYSDNGLLSWQPANNKNILWSTASQLPDPINQKIKNQFRASILPLERVLLDIHSGRFFGFIGIILVDISGILLIILALSGCVIWIRHKIRTFKRQ